MPTKPAWFEVFGVNEADIKAVCEMILKLYARKIPNQEELEEVIENLRKEYENSKLKARTAVETEKIEKNSIESNSVSNKEKSTSSPKEEDVIRRSDQEKKENDCEDEESKEEPGKRQRQDNYKEKDKQLPVPRNKKESLEKISKRSSSISPYCDILSKSKWRSNVKSNSRKNDNMYDSPIRKAHTPLRRYMYKARSRSNSSSKSRSRSRTRSRSRSRDSRSYDKGRDRKHSHHRHHRHHR